jgi:hypothetical protein
MVHSRKRLCLTSEISAYFSHVLVQGRTRRYIPPRTENHGVPGSNPGPPLLKVLRIAGKVRASAVLPEPCDIGLSIAGSSTDRIPRTVVEVVISEHWCGRGMILGIACCGDHADRHFEYRPRPTRRRCLPTGLLRLDVLAGCGPVPRVSPRLRSPVPTRPTHGAHHCMLGGCS